jgi:phage gp46-like protein
LFPEVQGDQIGSKLWLLKREKRTLETLNRAEEYAVEALQWMIEDGVADSVEASASWNTDGAMQLEIMLTMPSGKQNFRFKLKWATEAERN